MMYVIASTLTLNCRSEHWNCREAKPAYGIRRTGRRRQCKRQRASHGFVEKQLNKVSSTKIAAKSKPAATLKCLVRRIGKRQSDAI